MKSASFLWIVLLGLVSCKQENNNAQLSGSQIYASYCVSCHGASGNGSAVAPFDLTLKDSLNNKNQFFEIVFNGKPGTMMKGFEGRLKNEDIEKVRMMLLEIKKSK